MVGDREREERSDGGIGRKERRRERRDREDRVVRKRYSVPSRPSLVVVLMGCIMGG